MYHVLELAGVKFKTYFSPTTVDPPDVIRFIKTHYPQVTFIRPKKSMYALAVERGMLPSMRVRYCCAEYKENTGAGQCTTIGIRKAESARRARRHEVEISSRKFSGDLDGLDKYREEFAESRKGRKAERSADGMVKCINGKESLLISPIFDWTDKDVWEFLNDVVQVPHCKLYDEGQKRIGCVLCPMASYKQKVAEIHRYPHNKHLWIKAIMDIRRGGYHNTQIHRELEKTENGSRAKTDSEDGTKTTDYGWSERTTKFYSNERWT